LDYESASMGPRPRGRGIPMQLVWADNVVRASMGPRPRGRGISPNHRFRFLGLLASMGPRPRGRGIEAERGHSDAVVRLCFNGAATARSRNLN